MEKLHTSKFKLIVKVFTLLCLLNVSNIWGQVSHIVISQVYGGGGNASATYQNDFVELYNPTCASINISVYSVQYTSSAGTTWISNNTGALIGSIPAGGYYLIKMNSGGAVGLLLPTADFSATGINMSATGGKVVLVNQTPGLGAVSWPSVAVLIDGVGYGTTADVFEGSGRAPLGSNTTGDKRNADCIDTDNNNSDFSAATPNPRNSVTAISLCPSCSGGCTAPVITSQPTSILTNTAGTGTFTVAATGAALSYQWQVNSGAGFANVAGAVYSGATTASLTLTNPTLSMDTYSYQCIVSNTCSTATSSTATLSIFTCATSTITPTTQTVCISSTAAIVASAPGSITSYQWQMSFNNSTWVAVATGTPSGVTYAGAATGSLTVNSTSAVAIYYYRSLIVNSAGCSYTTSASSLIIDGISADPYDVYTSPVLTSTFAVVVAGTPTSYQWRVNTGAGYSNVANGGVYAGATSSLLTITNPPTSMNTYSYQCVVAYACATYTSAAAILNVTAATSATCPKMTGALINSCNGTCSEGDNEILFFNSGTSSIPVAPANIVVTYGSTINPPTSYSGSFTTNAAQTANLNALSSSSCATLFVDASVGGTIPANSVFMMVRNSNCFNSDFSSFCSVGKIYILYSTDISWVSAGNFSNGGIVGELRFFKANFSAVAGGCSTSYNYQPDFLIGGDGAGISFPTGGGAANAYFNNGCSPPKTILPIELLDFYATKNGKKNDVFWKVASEINVVYYIIEKSNDGVNFTELTTVFTNNTTRKKTYSVVDDSPFDDITYYRLGTKEKDGKINYYKIISVDEKSTHWNYYHYHQNQSLVIEFKNTIPKNSTITLFDLSGKLLVEQAVNESQTKINTQAFAEGIYFVKITTPYKIENFKIIISK